MTRTSSFVACCAPVAAIALLGFTACRNSEARAAAAPALRVCADPNNLPFSDSSGAGFENRIASLIASDLGRRVEYTWWAQRRGFVRNTLRSGLCDVVIGIPTSYDLLAPTRPYYRSTYVFVTRKDRNLHITSFDDPQLEKLRIGVQIIGDDYSNTPPAHALARRGITKNVRGYTVIGDYSKPHPPSSIMTAVERGDVDVAVVWGPLAGYFAAHDGTPLELTPVSPQIDTPFLPFVFDISLGVRREDSVFRRRLDSVLVNRRPQIDSILRDYGVPRVDLARDRASEVK
jgi:mxaJ protein